MPVYEKKMKKINNKKVNNTILPEKLIFKNGLFGLNRLQINIYINSFKNKNVIKDNTSFKNNDTLTIENEKNTVTKNKFVHDDFIDEHQETSKYNDNIITNEAKEFSKEEDNAYLNISTEINNSNEKYDDNNYSKLIEDEKEIQNHKDIIYEEIIKEDEYIEADDKDKNIIFTMKNELNEEKDDDIILHNNINASTNIADDSEMSSNLDFNDFLN